MKELRSRDDYDRYQLLSIEKVCREVFPELICDLHLPDEMEKIIRGRGFNPLGSIVWVWPKDFIGGCMAPITKEGLKFLEESPYVFYHDSQYRIGGKG